MARCISGRTRGRPPAVQVSPALFSTRRTEDESTATCARETAAAVLIAQCESTIAVNHRGQVPYVWGGGRAIIPMFRPPLQSHQTILLVLMDPMAAADCDPTPRGSRTFAVSISCSIFPRNLSCRTTNALSGYFCGEVTSRLVSGDQQRLFSRPLSRPMGHKYRGEIGRQECGGEQRESEKEGMLRSHTKRT